MVVRPSCLLFRVVKSNQIILVIITGRQAIMPSKADLVLWLTFPQHGVLLQVIKGVGGFRHEDWRSFQSERVVAGRPSKGFLDGDLIESYLVSLGALWPLGCDLIESYLVR